LYTTSLHILFEHSMSSVPSLPPLTPSRQQPQGMVALSPPERVALFRKFDSSGNGSLSMGEARAAVAQGPPEPSRRLALSAGIRAPVPAPRVVRAR
jgi:hypothetical protein